VVYGAALKYLRFSPLNDLCAFLDCPLKVAANQGPGSSYRRFVPVVSVCGQKSCVDISVH
jgi:hypothetical protein